MNILITGANSYIGTYFENYILNNTDWNVDTLDVKGDAWENYDFKDYDVVFHVAGIAHSDNGKLSAEQAQRYYDINTKLTSRVANKAKCSGVKQFIFMSSAIVYGKSASIGGTKNITVDTSPSPENAYGDSKVQAELILNSLNSKEFKVVIIRSPMIYGEGCKGNYVKLSKFALKFPIYPYVNNRRSMIYIGNLVRFIRLNIENADEGIFWPQNNEFVNTCDMIKEIRKAHGKKTVLVKGFAWLLKIASIFTGLVNKIFGNITYDESTKVYNSEICFSDSIRLTEKNVNKGDNLENITCKR